VDAFFVLSGYLITALLLAEHRATGEIDLRAFWVRRARRLLPALLAVLAATAVFAAVVAEPAARHGIRLDALAALAYVANWRMLAAGGYFDRLALPSPLSAPPSIPRGFSVSNSGQVQVRVVDA
jgi:peptidoglycan/LPS O-acetylase OafA/YrhL